jgi:hypothetical protein
LPGYCGQAGVAAPNTAKEAAKAATLRHRIRRRMGLSPMAERFTLP